MADQLALFDLPHALPAEAADAGLPESIRLLLAEGFPGESVAPLMEECGGLVLTISARPTADSPLAQVIGLYAAQVIGRVLGGARFTVPKGAEALRAARNAAIRRDYDSGIRPRHLVRTYGLTERQIRTILSAA